VIAHGLSLMWMAGLVTNRWWNDLWFGEAFADYIGHRATSEVTRFPGPLTTFAVRRKAEAYVADQRPSTHPVALSSQDVQSALLDLDRISYFKGSSVLRQLAATIGPSDLRRGLRTYFERHAYGNGSFAEFVQTLSEVVGTDLTGWVDAWFHQPGVTTLRPEITVAGGRITAAVLHQDGVPRPHTLHIGLYSAQCHETLEVRVSGSRTSLPELVGRPAPEFVLVNEDDLTYATVWLDERSRTALPEWLPRLSPLNRAMVWCGLLMAVRDGVLPAEEYLDLAVGMLAEEPDLSILVEVLEHLRDEVAGRYLPDRRTATDRLSATLRQRLAGMPAGDERQVALARGLVEFSSDAEELRDWLADRSVPDGLLVDEDLGWRVRYRLAILGRVSATELEAALAAAPSAHAEQMAARARAARPDPSLKATTWTTVMAGADMSNYLRWALAEGFWQPDQVELTRSYEERFFAEIADVARAQGDLALGQLVRFFYPRFAARMETLRHSEKLMGRTDVSAALKRKVADATDDLRRVVATREST
jgi:aminopeptidase N